MYSLILHGRKLRHLSVSLQNASAFSNSAIADGRKGKLAESVSKKVSFEEKGNSDSVLNLLTSHGFTNSQISSIITSYPRLLTLDAEKSLCPKLKSLESRGASKSELTEVLSKVPEILGKRGVKVFTRYYDFVKVIIESDKSSEHVKLCPSLEEGSMQGNKIRNVLVLRELGVPQKLLFSVLMSRLGTVCGKEKFEDATKKVVEMGFDPTTSKFVTALEIVYKLSDKTIQEKVDAYRKLGFGVGDVYKMFKKAPVSLKISEKNILNSLETYTGLGFTRDEFVMMVKSFPSCIGFSAETVKKKTEFLVKQMNWPLKALVSYPNALGYSLEKRIVPRCNVIKALMSKGLLKDRGSELPPMSCVVGMTDQVFLEMFVRKHDDEQLVSELMTIFTGDRVS